MVVYRGKTTIVENGGRELSLDEGVPLLNVLGELALRLFTRYMCVMKINASLLGSIKETSAKGFGGPEQ